MSAASLGRCGSENVALPRARSIETQRPTAVSGQLHRRSQILAAAAASVVTRDLELELRPMRRCRRPRALGPRVRQLCDTRRRRGGRPIRPTVHFLNAGMVRNVSIDRRAVCLGNYSTSTFDRARGGTGMGSPAKRIRKGRYEGTYASAELRAAARAGSRSGPRADQSGLPAKQFGGADGAMYQSASVSWAPNRAPRSRTQ